MLSNVEADARLTRYLLGAVSETERENIEAEYLADAGVFEQVLIAEDELVDAYARGELSDGERRQFEKNFLTSARGRERVHFSRALTGAVSDARVPVTVSTSPSFFAGLWAGLTTRVRVATVTFAALVVIAFSWLLVERTRMRTELQELRAERARLTEQSKELQRVADAERARNAELAAQVHAEQQPTPAVQVAQETDRTEAPKRIVRSEGTIAFNLVPLSVRGSSGTVLAVPRKATSVVLQLGLERASLHNEYRAAIETVDGRPVWSKVSFGSRQVGTELNGVNLPPIPARALPPGDYVLLLSGKISGGDFEPVANYSFRIARK